MALLIFYFQKFVVNYNTLSLNKQDEQLIQQSIIVFQLFLEMLLSFTDIY